MNKNLPVIIQTTEIVPSKANMLTDVANKILSEKSTIQASEVNVSPDEVDGSYPELSRAEGAPSQLLTQNKSTLSGLHKDRYLKRTINHQELHLFLDKPTAISNNRNLHLTPREYKVLRELMINDDLWKGFVDREAGLGSKALEMQRKLAMKTMILLYAHIINIRGKIKRASVLLYDD